MIKNTKKLWGLAKVKGTSPFEQFAINILQSGKYYCIAVSKSKGFKLGLQNGESYILTDTKCKAQNAHDKESKQNAKQVGNLWMNYLAEQLANLNSSKECLENH